MTKHTKIVLGLMTFVPMVLVVLFVLSMLDGWFKPEYFADSDESPLIVFMPLGVSVLLFILSMVLSLGMTVYYLVHAINNPMIDGSHRLVWVLTLLLGGLFTCALYWLFQIWREDDDRLDHKYTD